MGSFLAIIAGPAVQKVSEKRLFGGPYVRLGRLFTVIGLWLFQQGGALGYGLRDEPGLLSKLLVSSRFRPSSEKAAEWVRSLRDPAESRLAEVQGQDKNFLQLYAIPELQALGIEIIAYPPPRRLDDKADPNFVSDVMFVSFSQGGGLGYHFPETFKEYWEHHYRPESNTEWQGWRMAGVVLAEKQSPLQLSSTVADLAAGALEWAFQDAPGYLDKHEVEVLKELAGSTG